VEISGDAAHLLHEKRVQRKLQQHQQHIAANPLIHPSNLSNHLQSLPSDDETSHSDHSSIASSASTALEYIGDWTAVTSKHSIGTSVSSSSSINETFSCSNCLEKLDKSSFTRSQIKKGLDRKCSHCLKSASATQGIHRAVRKTIVPSTLIGAPTVIINKSLIKREKKKFKRQQEAETLIKETGSRFSALDPLDSGGVRTESSQEMISLRPWKDVWRSSPATALMTEQNMGSFRSLNRDTAVHLMTYLAPNDILNLGASCRGTESLCDDWLIWRNLFHRQYPRSALKPSGANSSWKRAYLLEINCLSQDLMCFNSRVTKCDQGAILGIPIWYTTNPKTGCLDYATSTFDIISYESYSKNLIRRTVWGEKFTNFLPIYIDEEHFKRGLGLLVSVSKEIVMKGISTVSSSSMKNGRPSHQKLNLWAPKNEPEMVLTFLTKMMNTQVVLLCDKGISASEVALIGYCQLHRLLLATLNTFPQLKILIRQRLKEFAQKPDRRVKEFTPSLGELLAYLSVSDTYGWDQLSMAYLKECFDRSVLWSCTKDPSLAIVISGDLTRLDKYLETQRVSLRLTLYHAIFLRMLVDGGGTQEKLDACVDRYDVFQGRPPLYLRRQWQEKVKDILEFNSWPQFFSLSTIPLPTKAQLLYTLEASVQHSLTKGYHRKDTIFEQVMKSGVSQILLKGETYSTAPNLSKIRLMEKWRFDGHVFFLDASCLVYDFSHHLIGTVDYNHTQWSGSAKDVKLTRVGSYVYGNISTPCISHSGDVIDHENGVGQHTIDIDIKRLPSSVQSLFFTVSAWNSTLKEISQPSAHLYDVKEDTELCSYQLEETKDTKTKTAVVMCRLFRKTLQSRWELKSIGQVGFGRAGSYDAILKDIRKYLQTEANTSARTEKS
jgi:stress response protein SCP2